MSVGQSQLAAMQPANDSRRPFFNKHASPSEDACYDSMKAEKQLSDDERQTLSRQGVFRYCELNENTEGPKLVFGYTCQHCRKSQGALKGFKHNDNCVQSGVENIAIDSRDCRGALLPANERIPTAVAHPHDLSDRDISKPELLAEAALPEGADNKKESNPLTGAEAPAPAMEKTQKISFQQLAAALSSKKSATGGVEQHGIKKSDWFELGEDHLIRLGFQVKKGKKGWLQLGSETFEICRKEKGEVYLSPEVEAEFILTVHSKKDLNVSYTQAIKLDKEVCESLKALKEGDCLQFGGSSQRVGFGVFDKNKFNRAQLNEINQQKSDYPVLEVKCIVKGTEKKNAQASALENATHRKKRAVTHLQHKRTHSSKVGAKDKVGHSYGLDHKKALHDAVLNGNKKEIESLLEKGIDIDMPLTPIHMTAFQMATLKGDLDMGRFLLDKGANINACTPDYNNTSLIWAAEEGKTEAVKFLLENEADFSLCTTNNRSPLFMAADKGHTEVVKLLINAGASVNALTTDQRTALHQAVARKDKKTAQALLDGGADTNICMPNDVTALHLATETGSVGIATALLKKGANADACSHKKAGGCTALYLAAQKGDLSMVRCLLEHKANPNVSSAKGFSPLWVAIYKGHSDIVELLQSNGAEINMPDCSIS